METHELPSVLFMTPPIALEMWEVKPSGSISGGGAIDAPCTEDNDCGEGLSCFTGSLGQPEARCRPTCTYPGPECPEGVDCVTITPIRRVDDVELGVCAVD